MPLNIHIGWCPTARIAELQRLIDGHWRRGHVLATDEALLRWQYRHLASPDHLAIMVATDRASNEIIGCLGLIQAPFGDRGQRRLALWMSMWLLVPEARGQGIGFSLLDQAIQEGYEVIACVGFNDITKRLVSGMGFHIRDAMPRWVRPIDSASLLSLTESRVPPYSQSIRARWAATIAVPIPVAPGTVRPWGSDLETLWDQAWCERFAPAVLATWHDSEYLRWRYLDHPSFAYDIRVVCGEGDRVEGLMVHRIEQVQTREERIFRIVELIGEAGAGERLLAHAVSEAAQQGAAFIDLHCTATTTIDALREFGFYRDDEEAESDRLPRFFQPLDFRAKPLNFTLWADPAIHPRLEEYVASNQLYFTRADGDQDRPN